jgi:small multidrug resistance family-3 protein
MAFDGFHPDRFDLIGADVCIVGFGVIMYAPR